MPSNKKPIKKEVALSLAVRVSDALENAKVKVEICGSLRRLRPIVHDVDMVVSVSTVQVYEILKPRFGVSTVLTKKGDKYGNFVVEGIQFDFFPSNKESWGAAVLFLTGSGLFNIFLRGIAKDRGYKLNQTGLWFGEDLIAGRTEEQIFDALGFEFLSPPEREVTPDNKKRHWLREKLPWKS